MDCFNEKILVDGNKAIAHGALESGVSVCTSYPGTPATQILDYIKNDKNGKSVYTEWSVNEKVAFEIALGASYSGARALCSMKHLGLNTVIDSLTVAAYTGVNGGLVIVVADDIAPHSSQTATDTRNHAILAKVPCLEPSNAEEAMDFVKMGFEISEKFNIPLLVRVTPRICHSKFMINCNENINYSNNKHMNTDFNKRFEKDSSRYICIPQNTKELHKKLNKKLKEIECYFSNKFNKIISQSKNNNAGLSVITSSFCYNYVIDFKKTHSLDFPVFKLNCTNPIPENLFVNFLKNKKKVLIVEELEPIIEKKCHEVAHIYSLAVKIYGKQTNNIPLEGELSQNIIKKAFLDLKIFKDNIKDNLPKLPSIKKKPSLCAGCPHRSVYYFLNQIKKNDTQNYNVIGDRGCYNLGAHPPLSAIDTCLCMGASISVAQGLSLIDTQSKNVAVIGDSTFLHSGLLALINAAHNNVDLTVFIMDNNWTSMTGGQENPATKLENSIDKRNVIEIEAIIKSIQNVKYLSTDAYDFKNVYHKMKSVIDFKGVSVLHIKSECTLKYQKYIKQKKEQNYYFIEECNGCGDCLEIGCPALINKGDFVDIDTDLCIQCGLCHQICESGCVFRGKK